MTTAKLNPSIEQVAYARAATVTEAMRRDVMATRDALDRLIAKQRNTGAITPSEVARRAQVQPAPETSAELRQTVDQLFDDVATLPIFSGTCPRVADPGRFDPAPVSTDQQLSMF